MTQVALPDDLLRRALRKRRLESFMREGMSPRQAVRAVALIEAAQMADAKRTTKKAQDAGATSTAPSPLIYKDTAVDRLAQRMKDFMRSSEDAFRLAVQTAQRTERESAPTKE